MVSTRKRKGSLTLSEGKNIRKRIKAEKVEFVEKENAELASKHVGKSSEEFSSDEEIEEPKVVSLAEKMKANLVDNAKFFAELNIGSVKNELAEVAAVKPVSMKPTTKGYKEKPAKKEKLPPRKSLRLQNITPEGEQLPDKPKTIYFNPEPSTRAERVEGDVEMSKVFKNDSEDGSHNKFLDELGNLKEGKVKTTAALDKFLKEVNKMIITEDRVTKVTKDRIFSVAIHPTEDKVLAIAGDKWGKVGFWNVGSADNQDGVFCYEPHCRPVKQMTVPAGKPDQLFTCSYDGQLRCCYFEKAIFQEVYSTDEYDDILLTGFDFYDHDTMLVSQWNGAVAKVDVRAPSSTKACEYPVSHKQARSVSFHPVDKNYFATAHQDGQVMLWDMRKMNNKKNTCLQMLPHNRVVESAYFSPVTGKYLLTTGMDNKLRIYNSANVGSADLSLKKAVTHDNWTGRWLSKFRATWHPTREDVFIVGSMLRPRQIEMFSDEGALVKAFKNSDWLGSVCSLNAFHPTRNILVGGNSSGRLHVFM